MIAEVPVDDCVEIRSNEVRSFMYFHGLTLEDACKLAELDPADYAPKSRPAYIPLPGDIERDCAAIRSGELVIVQPQTRRPPQVPR